MPTPISAENAALRFFNAYAATVVATGSVLATLFLVPQTGAILAKAGLDEYPYDPSGTLLRTAAFVGMALAYVLLYLVVIPPDPKLQPDAPPTGPLARVQLWALQRSQFFSNAVLGVLARFSDGGRRVVGVLIMVLGLMIAWFGGPEAIAARHDTADFASSWPGIMTACFGAWVALLPVAAVRDPAQLSWGWRVPGRLLIVVASLALLGEALWALPIWSHGSWGTQSYTVWGVGFLVFLAAVVGRLVDAAALRTAWPIRMIAAAGALAIMGGDASDTIAQAGPGGQASTNESEGWYKQMLARVAAMPGDGPVVLVAASGGGSRAALFAALTYEALEATHLTEDPKSPTVGSHILLISSVSGGSLASAYFQRAIAKDGALPVRDQWRNVPTKAMGQALQIESTRLVKEATRRFGQNPIQKALFYNFVAVDGQLAG